MSEGELVERQFARLREIEDALANGARRADDPECHPLYPQAVAARQILEKEFARLATPTAPIGEEPSEEYEEVFVPMGFEEPVGRDLEEWRENVRKTELYRRGDTVLVWVNEGDLYCDGPFVKHLRKRAAITALRSGERG